MKLISTLRSAMANQILVFLDAAFGFAAEIEFYTGTMPLVMGDPITDTLLVTHVLPIPAGTETGGTFTGGVIADVNGIADGNAGWCRLLDGAGLEVAYLAVGITGSGASVEMNTVQVVTGVPVRVTALAFTIAGA